MLTTNNLSKSYGGRVLFQDVTVAFRPGINYGLTGPNGAGKSTFMKLLLEQIEADHGTVHLPKRTAWLRQDHFAFDEQKVIDCVLMGNKRLYGAMQEKEFLYAKSEISDDDGMRLGELEMIVMEEDGYTAETEAMMLLTGLGVEESLHQTPMAEIQSGMKLRVLLAQALFGKPDALLLDEPTNHLDLDTIRWLEEFLMEYRGVLVVISHDRRFLNVICDEIADIDYESIVTYPGNYDDMVRQKASMQGSIERDSSDRKKKIAELEEFISRFRAGSRASQTRSRARQVEKLRPEELKRSNIARPFIRFDAGGASGKNVVSCKELSKSFEVGTIFKNFHSHVQRGDKVAVIGKNGIGKTTLMRTLLSMLPDHDGLGEKVGFTADEGTIEWGHNIKLGYYSQNAGDEIEAGTTVYRWLRDIRDDVDEQAVRGLLGRMLFIRDDHDKPTGGLSGGERARLQMCRLSLMQYNVLILDEPTNHLDLESISALGDAIDQYQGTVFYVTHDRDLASKADRIFAYDDDGTLTDFSGSVYEWIGYQDKHRKG
ncbi:MAG: ATPase subunit of ABC transporter with duplicated ATPase domains [Bradymonadia bacterium]|jgi:ATPase subunit of ABC transporter with duplicated ATPase domains